MALNPGSTLSGGKYRIVQQLGRGGFGSIYLVQDTLLGEEVAIRELIPGVVGDEAVLKRFLTEAKAAMRLAPKRIVRTQDIFSEGGNYYIVMEYMPGGSLEARLQQNGPLPPDEATSIAAQVCGGLECAHEEGIVHSDLRPANILFAADGSAKIADFGIAHASEQMLGRSRPAPAGFAAGALPYMSPEQADGVRDDPRVDLYAVGAILYRMLAGRTYLDFDQRDTPGATADNVLRIRSQQPLPPSAHARHVPAWLDAVVLKALAKRPAERYATAAELRAALSSRGKEAAPAASAAGPQGQPETVWASTPPGPASYRAAAAPPPPLPVSDRAAAPPPPPLPAFDRAAAPPPPPLAASDRAASAPQIPSPSADRRGQSRPATFWPLVGAAAILVLILAIAAATLLKGRNGQDTAALTAMSSQSEAEQTSLAGGEATLGGTRAPMPLPATPQATGTLQLPTGTPLPTPQATTALQSPGGTPLPSPTPMPIVTWTRPRDSMIMVYVPAGVFVMGSTKAEIEAAITACMAEGSSEADCQALINSEGPQHTVTLDAFWIDRTEVTNAMFARFVAAAGYKTDGEKLGSSWTYNPSTKQWGEMQGADWQHPRGPSSNLDGLANHPVLDVSWNDAVAYCQWAGARLPTEAEWEKAARGADGRTYPWGNIFDGSKVNFCDTSCELDWKDVTANDGYARTAPVGSYPAGASPYGALDMAGNVWEWVHDWYDGGYYALSPAHNPQGPDSGQVRGQRGGSWSLIADWMRLARRNANNPTARSDGLGFRCCLTTPAAPQAPATVPVPVGPGVAPVPLGPGVAPIP